MQTFPNPLQLSRSLLLLRLQPLDPDAQVQTQEINELEGIVYLTHIDSLLTTTQIGTLLLTPPTSQETDLLASSEQTRQQIRDQYQSTIATLEQIEAAASPTNAQVIAAVKFIAKTLRMLLKYLAKQFI